MRHRNKNAWVTFAGAVLLLGYSAAQAETKLEFIRPLERTEYQTNERIDLALVRSDAQALPAGEITLTLSGELGSKLSFSFPVQAVPLGEKEARATEHFYLNGWLLRPDRYTLDATLNNVTAKLNFGVHSHIRKSSFRTVDWGSRAKGPELELLNESGMGFNTVLGEFRFGATANVDGAIRGGLDIMQVCTMSGAHQMDIRGECDWSDPYVLGGGIARASCQAFISRTAPNSLGVHMYDEPGLTWADPGGPFTVPAQSRSFKSAFGKNPFPFEKVVPGNAEAREGWSFFQKWHESFMDAVWKQSAFAVQYIQPNYLPITQSVYGFSAYADGYYFNVVRSLPLISGHGGYSDGHTGFYYPAWHMEYGRMRDLNKPYWYLPSWYMMSSDQYRVEQYMSFMNNIQGMMKPPDHAAHNPNAAASAQGIAEANRLESRLGTIFTTMPVTRPPVAVLYSMSQLLTGEIEGIAEKNYGSAAYEGGGHSRAASLMTYIASKALHVPFFPVVEEDILDGTVARNHKVLVLPSVNYLEPNVVLALEGYIKGGGVVLVSDDSKVEIKGATKVGAPLNKQYYYDTGGLWSKDQKQYWIQASAAHYRDALKPFITALSQKLTAAGIAPVCECSNPGVVASRQAEGDFEYIFLVNGVNDRSNMNAVTPADADVALTDDGRPVYDAVHGVEATFKKDGGKLTTKLRFGAGEMRVFCRTTRPIGGVQTLPPTLFSDFTVAENPLRVTVGAFIVDSNHRPLSGSAPLEITVSDPLGYVRYNLFRATDHGLLKIDLPLAANDAAGEWTVSVRELLTGKEDTTTFKLFSPSTCGAVAGTPVRALIFGSDRENIFRFFRVHKDITLITGSSAFNTVEAKRLTETLAPWGVRCKIVAAADVNKPRQIPEDGKKAWVGLAPGRPDFNNPNVAQTGYALDGPAILIGSPEDNPLIAFAQQNGFLPYKSVKGTFPGTGHGLLAWQMDAVGYFNQESVCLIAHDEAGMAEAAGTLYELCAAIDPLMKWTPPLSTNVVAATVPAPKARTPELLWRAFLPDRIDTLNVDGETLTALSHEGTLATLDGKGVVTGSKLIQPDEVTKTVAAIKPAAETELTKKVNSPGLVLKRMATVADFNALAYWGGVLKVVDNSGAVKYQQAMPQDITALAVVKDTLIVGLADGEIRAVKIK
jgi:hypothetical protein